MHSPPPSGSLSAVDEPRRILCLNAGSSSLKIAVYDVARHVETLRIEGESEGVGLERGRLRLRGAGRDVARDVRFSRIADAAEALLGTLGPAMVGSIQAVGHRVVHGGPRLSRPRLVDEALAEELRALVPLAPLHQPGALDVMEAVARRLPGLPQVACFDTAFHHDLPELAQRLPLPAWLWEAGVRRYGFHGLSFESVVSQLGAELAPRTVIAHLGSGSSLVALRDGRPVDTTMGMTPIGGVMMGTRSGDLDPGVLLYLLRERGMDGERLERLVNEEAGLRGVSGTTSDMRALLERRSHDAGADLAVSLFCRSVRMAIGSLAAVLGGLDLLVFTGGIGERADPVRREIVAGLGHLGLDSERAAASPGASGRLRVVSSDENRVIARHVDSLLADG